MVVQRLRFYGALCAASLVIGTFAIAVSDAADGPNQLTESDFAAGQLVDSFFDNEMPDSLDRAVKQQRRTSKRRVALRGTLVDNPKARKGAPQFALVNRDGQVLRYVEATEEVNLEVYLGETVGVRHDTGKILLASQLALPKVAASEDTQLSAFNEDEPTPADEPGPIPTDEESVLTPESDQGPAIVDDGPYEEFAGDYTEEVGLGGCSTCGSGTCGGCAPGRGVMYVHADYLLWWLEGMKTPPLVIQSPNSNFSPAEIIYGGNNILEDVRHGGRITFGLWLDECGMWGVEGDYLSLGELEEVFTAGGNDGDRGPTGHYIGRPFFNTVQVLDGNTVVVPRGPSQEEVDTDNLDGYVTVTARSKFESAGLRLRHGLCFTPRCGDVGCGDQVGCGSGVNCGSGVGGWPFGGPLGRLCGLIKHGNRRTDVLYGLRWASLDESLGIQEDLLVVDGNAAPVGTTFKVQDHFGTSNDFFGGELGFMMEWERRRWSLGLLSKVAIGNTRQRVAIAGSTEVGGASDPGTEVGGLLTQRYTHPGNATFPGPFTVGNIGTYERDEFSMIPEIGATLGYCVTPRFKVTLGYTLLYWSNVVRAGEQIDLDVNAHLLDVASIDTNDANQVVPGDHPRFNFRQSDLWAHGLNFGGEYRW